jgi:hypothetical protein
MSSWDEVEEEVGGAFLSLADAPTEFTGTLTEMGVRKDSRGNNALFLTIEISSGGRKKMLVQKFTRAFIGTLTDAFEKLGVAKDDAIGKTYKWKQKQIGIRGNPRWIPVEVV